MLDKKISSIQTKDGEESPQVLSKVLTHCLTRHQDCSGGYEDSTNSFILKCGCICHKKSLFPKGFDRNYVKGREFET